MARVKERFPQKFFFLSSLALAVCVAGTLSSGAADDDKKAGKKVSGELGGYFVRVKSGITGEKELYYNKDGTLRAGFGDGLLDGDFSLDGSLMSDDGDGLGLGLSPEPIPAREDAGADRGEQPVPANDASEKNAPSAENAAPSREQPRRAVPAAEEPEGTPDEYSLLRKFSKKKDDFGINPENMRKVVDMNPNERYAERFSVREWQGSTAYGLRRFSGGDERAEMSLADYPRDGNFETRGLFDVRASLAGERMFIRNRDGLLEVRLSDRFSAQGRVRENSRAENLRVRESSGFSMQDINRYQFRRNRSTESGLPVVSPGGDGSVRRENFGGGNAGLQKK